MRVLRALIKSRGGAIGEYWREVNLSGFSNGYDFGPRPIPVYAFGFWWACTLQRLTSVSPARSYARIWKSADGLSWAFVQDIFYREDVDFPSFQTMEFANLSASFSGGAIIFTGEMHLNGSLTFYGFAILSEDGVNWNFDDAIGTNQQIAQAVAYSGNFLARSKTLGLYRSTDFANWTKTRDNVKSIAQGAERFVSCGSSPDAKLSYSLDGLTWTAVSAFASKTPGNVNFSGGRFWVQTFDSPRELWWSDDAVAWYQATVPAAYSSGTNQNLFNVSYADGIWFLPFTKAVFNDRGALLSSSGNAWQDVTSTTPNLSYFAEEGPFLFGPYGYSPQTAYVSP
jgi:hypothetical protein